MPNKPTVSAPPTLTLGPKWFEHRKRAGYRTDAQVAVAMDLDPTTVYRIQTGKGAPSARFIATALVLFPDATFDDLFRVVAPKARKRAA